jgi:hypothetical protein
VDDFIYHLDIYVTKVHCCSENDTRLLISVINDTIVGDSHRGPLTTGEITPS